ncbi:hypothetical protein OAH62_02870 [Candidatus Marinimicrobia bacterium]|nr:hypothetical protein [Candidatus Neomarinimicrobiota bacterium]
MRKYILSLVLVFSLGTFFSSCSTMNCMGGCCSTSLCSKTSSCSKDKDAKSCNTACKKSSCSKEDKNEG